MLRAVYGNANQTACADFPTGVDVAEDTAALLIYVPSKAAPEKMP